LVDSIQEVNVDRVFVHGLEVACTIGVKPEERSAPQELLVDLELETDCSVAGASDDLADAVDYETLSHRVRTVAQRSSPKLLETLAEAIAAALLGHYRAATSVMVRLAKSGVVVGSAAVGVEIRRGRRGCRQ
jgi:dihydroneopterin aldolase